jgi:hypothetical protein
MGEVHFPPRRLCRNHPMSIVILRVENIIRECLYLPPGTTSRGQHILLRAYPHLHAQGQAYREETASDAPCQAPSRSVLSGLSGTSPM